MTGVASVHPIVWKLTAITCAQDDFTSTFAEHLSQIQDSDGVDTDALSVGTAQVAAQVAPPLVKPTLISESSGGSGTVLVIVALGAVLAVVVAAGVAFMWWRAKPQSPQPGTRTRAKPPRRVARLEGSVDDVKLPAADSMAWRSNPMSQQRSTGRGPTTPMHVALAASAVGRMQRNPMQQRRARRARPPRRSRGPTYTDGKVVVHMAPES